MNGLRASVNSEQKIKKWGIKVKSMTTVKKLICVICSVALFLPFAVVGSAYDSAYNNDIDNLGCVTKVEDQGSREACLTYALASTAGSFYCKAYNNGKSTNKAIFKGAVLADKVGDSTNFGTVLYSSVKYDLGNNCYITGIENLTGRGDRYLKQKIKENGAIFAAIPLPENGFENDTFYNRQNASLNCYKDKSRQLEGFTKNHAVSIVGWDDSYNRDNYNGSQKNGAWICKNSYGENFGKNGYFYLSYNYTKHFLYAASVEVTQYPEIMSAETADSFWLGLFRAGAVGFRSGSYIDAAEIKIAGKNKAEQTVKTDVVNGYNFIALENPMRYSDIKVTVDGREIDSDSLIRYIVKPGKQLSVPAKPVKTENWLTDVDRLKVDLTENLLLAYSYDENDNSVNHKVALRSVDNRFVISPRDGYRFTEDTIVNIEMTQVDRVDPVTYSGTVSELVNNPDVDFVFSEDRIIIRSKDIGGAFVSGVRLELDENSKIKDVYLLEDNGSSHKLDKASYSISPEEIPDKGYYYASIIIDGFYAADDFKVVITRADDTDETYQADVASDGDKISVGIIIEIPEIESIIDTLISFWLLIMRLFADL